MIEATKDCLRKYIRFSGRSDSYEFWGFMLACFVASILAAILNAVVFGPEVSTTFKTTVTSAGEIKQGFHTQTSYGPGPFTTILGVLTAVPMLSAAWRRMQDTGRPGWYLLVPAVPVAGLYAALAAAPKLAVPVSEQARAAAPQLPEFIEIPQPAIWLVAGTLIAAFATLALWIFWLTRASDGDNRYGPPQAEEVV